MDNLFATTHLDGFIVKKRPTDMPRVFYGNFDFEHEIAGAGYNRPKQLERLNLDLIVHLLVQAAHGDLLFSSGNTSSGFLVGVANSQFPTIHPLGNAYSSDSDCELVPWGWSQPAIDLAISRGWCFKAPPIEAVTKANSRQFSADFEKRLGTAIPGAAQIDSLDVLETVIQDAAVTWNCQVADLGWLLKSEFGMSGRERIGSTGAQLDNSQTNWIKRRLVSGKRLYFEPRVESLCELSTQWRIANSEFDGPDRVTPELIGITELKVDRSGQFLGSILVDRPTIGKSLLGDSEFGLSCGMFDQILRDAGSIAKTAQQLGYHGPLGVDSMVYRSPDGLPVVRPVQDVNARFTMGQIALEWFRRFALSDQPAWLLVPVEWLDEMDSSTMRVTSPLVVGDQPVRRVGVLIDDPAVWQNLLTTNLRP